MIRSDETWPAGHATYSGVIHGIHFEAEIYDGSVDQVTWWGRDEDTGVSVELGHEFNEYARAKFDDLILQMWSEEGCPC